MANTDELNLINFSVGEPSKVLMDKYLKIVKEFVDSNDQGFNCLLFFSFLLYSLTYLTLNYVMRPIRF